MSTVSHVWLVLTVTQPLPSLLHPNAMDIRGPFGKKPTKNGNPYVLVVVDLLTRAGEMISIPDKSAKTVGRALIQNVFCQCGIPSQTSASLGPWTNIAAPSVPIAHLKKETFPKHAQCYLWNFVGLAGLPKNMDTEH